MADAIPLTVDGKITFANAVVTVAEIPPDSRPLDTVFSFGVWGVKPPSGGIDAMGVLVTKETPDLDKYIVSASRFNQLAEGGSCYVWNGLTTDFADIAADANGKISTLIVVNANADVTADYSAFTGAIIRESEEYNDAAGTTWNKQKWHGQFADIDEGQTIYVMSRYLAVQDTIPENKSIQNPAFLGMANKALRSVLYNQGISYFFKGTDQTALDGFLIGGYDASTFYVYKMIERDLITLTFPMKDKIANQQTLNDTEALVTDYMTRKYFDTGLVDTLGDPQTQTPAFAARFTSRSKGLVYIVYTYVQRGVVFSIDIGISDKAGV